MIFEVGRVTNSVSMTYSETFSRSVLTCLFCSIRVLSFRATQPQRFILLFKILLWTFPLSSHDIPFAEDSKQARSTDLRSFLFVILVSFVVNSNSHATKMSAEPFFQRCRRWIAKRDRRFTGARSESGTRAAFDRPG